MLEWRNNGEKVFNRDWIAEIINRIVTDCLDRENTKDWIGRSD